MEKGYTTRGKIEKKYIQNIQSRKVICKDIYKGTYGDRKYRKKICGEGIVYNKRKNRK